MTALLFFAIVLTFLCLLLRYLHLGQVGKASRAPTRLVRSTSWKPGAPTPDPLTSDHVSAVQAEQSRWTALDDQQLARFVRDSPH